jgi:hypothetical protein
MTFTNLMQLAELTDITEVWAKLLLESHNSEGYSELSEKGDIYAVHVMSDDGAIEFAVVKSLSPFTLEGITGSTTNLMSQITSGEIEVLGRLIQVSDASIMDISSLRERQLRDVECDECRQHSIDVETETVS